MPRKTKAQREAEAAAAGAQTDIEAAIQNAPTAEETAKQKLLEELRAQTPADLIKDYQAKETWMQGELKRLQEYLAPHMERNKAINAVLLEKALKEGVNNYATEFGTAYISRGFSHKVDPNKGGTYTNQQGETVTGREALLDWLLDNWNEYGAEHAAINIAIDGVKAYMAATKSTDHPEGLLPPGIAVERWIRLNIRKP